MYAALLNETLLSVKLYVMVTCMFFHFKILSLVFYLTIRRYLVQKCKIEDLCFFFFVAVQVLLGTQYIMCSKTPVAYISICHIED
jgi:hypothetical protein